MEIVHPTQRKDGHGTASRVEQELVDAAINAYAHTEVTTAAWKRRLLETNHYAALHLNTITDPLEDAIHAIEAQMFDRGYDRLDIETFGDSHAVITVVDTSLNAEGPVTFGPG